MMEDASDDAAVDEDEGASVFAEGGDAEDDADDVAAT